MSDDVHDDTVTPQIPQQPSGPDAQLLTFLIADVRGYTAFTQRSGDELAAKLAAKFAVVAREVVEQHTGEVLELRGDEALCVFVSPRQAIRAAVALQRRFVDETRWDPQLPLPVGIGIDIGEAVAVEGGYRGGALNLAARLCSMANPGEILATGEVAHLARRLEGLSYQPREPLTLKGMSDPVRPVRVLPDGEDPATQLAGLGALPPKPTASLSGPAWLPDPVRRHPWVSAVAVAAVVAVVAGGLAVVVPSGGHRLRALGENVVAEVDAGTGALRAQTAVGDGPSALVEGFGAIWAANAADNTVSKVDPRGHRVLQTITVGATPTGVAVGAGAVWVANSGDGTVSRIDPTSNRTTLAVKVGSGPASLAYADGAVWVVDITAGSLLRIDPATGTAATAARLPSAPAGIAAATGHVWVSSAATGTVVDFDIRTKSIVQSVHVGSDPRGLTFADGSLWVANNLDGTVSRINPSTFTVTAALPVGPGPVAVAATGHDIWAASELGASLTRIDSRSNRIVATVATRARPSSLVGVGRHLWVTTTFDPGLHRGGTERVTVVHPYSVDPAQGYDDVSEGLAAMLYDGLLGLRRATAATGSVVVPDLAVALPTVSSDGLTYAFRMRSGMRWSNGRAVSGDDIRRGLERTVAAGVWPLFGGIRGAAACTKSRCDLSQGVVVDAASGQVSIHLVQPDAEFDYKMASIGAVAVPAATPLGPLGRTFLPSTGPYAVAANSPTGTTLTRNPMFREWSPAAQPAGFPDRLVVTLHDDENTPLAPAVLDNSDWSNNINVTNLPTLRARYGDRVRTTSQVATHFVWLNTATRPFSDVRVRRAVAFAIDRAALVAKWPLPGVATCQLLPPTVGGYQPYCPYTLRPDATGQWHAPDVVAGQRLVAAAGARGARVLLVAPGPFAAGFGEIARAMRAIGLNPTVKALPGGTYFGQATTMAEKGTAQAGFDGWLADYPAASNFIEPNLSCHARNVPDSEDRARYCSATIDHQISAAERDQTDNPASSTQTWTTIDREIADLSPIIPVVNPLHVAVVSTRLHNVHDNPILGPLYDQAWVR